MKPGDTVRMKKVKTYGIDGRSWSEFKPIKPNDVFVMVLMGTEPCRLNDEGTNALDIGKQLKMLGWVPDSTEGHTHDSIMESIDRYAIRMSRGDAIDFYEELARRCDQAAEAVREDEQRAEREEG